jgi:hypothetical protein
MEALLNERNPETCLSLGLDCQSCVRHTAQMVASVCRGITPAALSNTFVQMYPSPACARMEFSFVTSYAEASVPRKPALCAVVAA